MRAWFLTVMVLMTPATGWAQDSDCLASWRFLGAYFGVPVTQMPEVTEVDGWCSVTGMRFGGSPDAIELFIAERVDWRTTGALRYADGDVAFPTELGMRVVGYRYQQSLFDPVMSYIEEVLLRSRDGVDIHVSLRFDPEAHELDIEHLTVDFPGTNSLAASGTIGGLDLTSLASATATFASAALKQASLEVVSDGWLQEVLLPRIGYALLAGSVDPASDVENMKAETVGWIGTLPDTVLTGEERAELAMLFEDMPDPRGTITVNIDAPSGFGAARLAPAMISGIGALLSDPARLFDGVAIDFSYSPLPE